MKTKNIAFAAWLCLAMSTFAFAQTGNGQMGGIVQDASKALIPGVTISATHVDTNVTQTVLTNEAGAYNFQALQPGVYRLSAELSGFKKVVNNDVQLPYAGQIRINFTLEVGQTNQTVNVSVASESLLKESSASVGDVLTRERIEQLPLVGNNVLDLLSTLPGLRSSELGTAFDTINGLGTNSINATRDGLSINDVRNPAQIYGTRVLSSTTMLPDLVGEIRLILAPVDAELGRGNSQIQISTRSGTNRYTGSASWNVRNSALDANTWTNNHTPFTDPFSGDVTPYTPKTWNNNHQYTISYGGPIQIPHVYDGKNKTFFYALFSQNIRNTRDLVSTTVLTESARLGVYRYWSGYNPLGWNPSSTLASPVYPQVATSASLIAVDSNGNPVRPVADPTSPTANPLGAGFVPYSGNLICFSVFGTQRLDANGGMVPFTGADCPDGVAAMPTGSTAWDAKRPLADTTGLINKFVKKTPKANYFGAGDGLNIAQIRWIRGRAGTADTLGGLVGTSSFANSKQFNLKIDHNISARHKVAASWSHQWDDSADNAPGYPDGIFGTLLRRPHTLTINGTSTLGASMVNEARFGMTYTLNQDAAPWESPNAEVNAAARDLMMPGGVSPYNADFEYLSLVNSGLGNVSTSNGYMTTTAAGNYQKSVLYNWADTLSWSKGKHAFKFGVDWRLPQTSGTGATQAYPTINLGNASNTATPSPFATTGTFNQPTDPIGYLPGLLNSAPTVNGVPQTPARGNVTSLLQYLNGSVASTSQNYWITSASNVTQANWDDISTNGLRIREQKSQELAIFVKDDFKVTKNLTLNLGLRWEYYGSPFIEGGFTSMIRDYGYGAFGPTRGAQTTREEFNKDPFKYFLTPGNLYLTGYGSFPTSPLSCQAGVQQNPLLPVSNCDPSLLAQVDFVGPGSPNPDIKAVPSKKTNFGPAIGFAYQVPWFGEGKTTVRGGYQQTFGNAGQNRSALNGGTEATLANAPGVVTNGSLAAHINETKFQDILATEAIGLKHIAQLVPVAPNQATPGQPLTVYGGLAGPGAGVSWNVYDPHLETPYTQNITLSVTRQISRNYTLEARYTGTLGRKQLGSLDINQNNVYHNPELFQALTDARAGTCTASAEAYKANYTNLGINPCDINGDPVLFDQMLAGLNINNTVVAGANTPLFGVVGANTVQPANTLLAGQTIYQTGAQHLRRSGAFQNNLSWGNFDGVADSLIGLAPTGAGPTGPGQGRQNLPAGVGTVAQTGLRNGCDRMGNGATYVQQTITITNGVPVVAFQPGFNASNSTPLRCFSEDYLHANPQFGSTAGSSVVYNTNTGRSSYNSLQVQMTARPTQGVSISTTWVWAKSFNVPGTGYIDPADRNLNYGVQTINPHALRTNGTIELPIGPNKLIFGNSSGWVARVLERWQTGFIWNASSGIPATFNPGQSHYYAASGYDVVSSKWKIPKAEMTWIEGTNTGTIYPDNQFIGVTDPSCFDSSIVTMGDRMGTVLGRVGSGTTATGPCTIFALAERKADGTAGDILLQYPAPGKLGSLGRQNLRYFGQWSFDMNVSKAFRISESKSVQLRFDATNMLNHPVPNTPTLGASNLGAVNGKGNQVRNFQGQVRISF